MDYKLDKLDINPISNQEITVELDLVTPYDVSTAVVLVYYDNNEFDQEVAIVESGYNKINMSVKDHNEATSVYVIVDNNTLYKSPLYWGDTTYLSSNTGPHYTDVDWANMTLTSNQVLTNKVEEVLTLTETETDAVVSVEQTTTSFDETYDFNYLFVMCIIFIALCTSIKYLKQTKTIK